LISGQGAGAFAESISAFHKQFNSGATKNQLPQGNLAEQIRDILRRMVYVADTVAYVHHRGIVHRDLKPSNILIGPYGETLIADWGLARQIGSNTPNGVNDDLNSLAEGLGTLSDTHSDATAGIGTPGYAAPELAQGTQLQALCSADIYSLGAMLYCVLTGKTPGNNPSSITCSLDVPAVESIEAICRKAMARDRSERYATAEEFRDDLLKWIAGEPVSAHPEGIWEEAIRWPSRNRSTAAGLASALAITFVAGTLFLLYQSRQANILASQSVQLQAALDKSETLLEETRQAKQSAEIAQEVAEQAQSRAEKNEREAVESKQLAEKRGELVYDGLIRFQDLVTSNDQVFRSSDLSSLHDALMENSRGIVQAILMDIEREFPPSINSLKRLGEMTHRLATMESSLKKVETANSIFVHTCDWMLQRLNSKELPPDTELFLQIQIGKLRSLQGTLLMRNSNYQLAKPFLMDSVIRLREVLSDEKLRNDDKGQVHSSLACALSSLSMHEFYAGNFDNAKMLQEQAILSLGTEEPRNYDDAMVHVQVHGNMAVICEKASLVDQAVQELVNASADADIAERMISENPGGVGIGNRGVKPTIEHIRLRSQLAYEQARLLVAEKKESEAKEVLQVLLKKERASVKLLPNDSALLEAYQATATKLQALMISTGDHAQATRMTEAWMKLAEEFYQEYPTANSTLLFLIIAHHSAGHLHEKIGNKETAIEKYRMALEDCDRANSIRGRVPEISYQRVELEMHMFELQLPNVPWIDVEQYFQRAVRSAQELAAVPTDTANMLPNAKTQLARGIAALRGAHREDDAARWESDLRLKNLTP
jgi:tetratricopeptide (TPR) repeat protein